MNTLTHSEPHNDCEGCRIMAEARESSTFWRPPLLEMANDDKLPPSDIKDAELRLLLEEVLESPFNWWLGNDLLGRIREALAK